MARTSKGEAGIPTVVEAIAADPELTDTQKDILIGAYDRVVNGDGMDPQRLQPLSDVCPLLNVSLRTGYRWIRDGAFPITPVRIGAKIMFRAADVDALLAGRR